jgi:hypothetical protein
MVREEGTDPNDDASATFAESAGRIVDRKHDVSHEVPAQGSGFLLVAIIVVVVLIVLGVVYLQHADPFHANSG